MTQAFRHEALFYAGANQFLDGVAPFVRDGVRGGDAVLVVDSRPKIELLRGALGSDAEAVMFADMAAVGANPAWIIPAWRDFVEVHGAHGRGLRGVGEPIWNGRTDDELVECQRHESLLNVAFAGGRPWRLLCPYDTSRLSGEVVDEARRSHEYVIEAGTAGASSHFRGVEASGAPFDAALPEPRPGTRTIAFDADTLLAVRGWVGRFGTASGLPASRATELVTAVNEVATNSVVHGGGTGVLRMWRTERDVVCEVRDGGAYRHALGDRRRPGERLADSRGLWSANQLCDLVQIRSLPEGNVVRLHVNLARE